MKRSKRTGRKETYWTWREREVQSMKIRMGLAERPLRGRELAMTRMKNDLRYASSVAYRKPRYVMPESKAERVRMLWKACVTDTNRLHPRVCLQSIPLDLLVSRGARLTSSLDIPVRPHIASAMCNDLMLRKFREGAID